MALITDANGRPIDDQGGRVHGITGAPRTMILFQAVAAPIIMTGVAVYLATTRGHQMIPFAIILPIASLASSTFLVGFVLKTATVLYPDRIEARSLFQTRTVQKADIASFRYVKLPKGGSVIEVTLKQPGQKPAQLSPLGPRADYDLWFKGIPETGAAMSFAAPSIVN
jgi:type IV secretory pathway TrbD component